MGAQPQLSQWHPHNEGVAVHGVRVGAAPGVIERVERPVHRNPPAVIGTGELHQRVVHPGGAHRVQAVVVGAVPVGVNKHVVGAARGHLGPIAPG